MCGELEDQIRLVRNTECHVQKSRVVGGLDSKIKLSGPVPYTSCGVDIAQSGLTADVPSEYWSLLVLTGAP
jgi:hypothetical protein